MNLDFNFMERTARLCFATMRRQQVALKTLGTLKNIKR